MFPLANGVDGMVNVLATIPTIFFVSVVMLLTPFIVVLNSTIV